MGGRKEISPVSSRVLLSHKAGDRHCKLERFDIHVRTPWGKGDRSCSSNAEGVLHHSPGSAGTTAWPWSAAPPWVAGATHPMNPVRVLLWPSLCATLTGLTLVGS